MELEYKSDAEYCVGGGCNSALQASGVGVAKDLSDALGGWENEEGGVQGA